MKSVFDAKFVLELLRRLPLNVFWKNADGVYLGCNDAFAQSLGLASADDIVGQSDYTLAVQIKEADFYRKDDLSVMQSNSPKLNIEEEQTFPGGRKVYLLTSKVPLTDDNNKVNGILGIYSDITELKLAQNQLVIEKERAEAANRAKTEFLSNMSHDIRTPLTGMLGMLDIILPKVRDAELTEYLLSFKESTEQLLSFLNQIIDMSVADHETMLLNEDKIVLTTFVAELKRLVVPSLYEKSLAFNVELADNLPDIFVADKTKLLRALLNIVGNAIKFTQQGSITLKVDLEYKISKYKQLCFTVIDTGIGIPEDKMDLIFNQFEKLHSSYKGKFQGAGLGLSISKRFVEAMGGYITVESREGEGSSFALCVPVNCAQVASENKVTTTHSLPVTKAAEHTVARILVVEDDRLAQSIASHHLQNLGFEVTTANSGENALQLCEDEQFDLIITDIGLPGMGGFAFCDKIKQSKKSKNQQTPIVALTAHINGEKVALAKKHGLLKIINKPLDDEKCAYIASIL